MFTQKAASNFLNGLECFDKQIKPFTWTTAELIYVNHLLIYVNTRFGGCLHESTPDLCKSICAIYVNIVHPFS